MDIDIFVSFRNVTARGYKTEGEYMVIEGWPVQFLPPGNALAEEALAQAIETDLDGVPTRVMTAEHLTAIALQTGRAKDHARILQLIESGALDADKLDEILKRHALVEKWERFGDKFLKGDL